MLLLFFCLQAQRRGTAKFISSPDQLSDWDSSKTVQHSIRRADVVSDGTQSRRARYRTTTDKSTPVTTTDEIGDTEIKTAAKVPTYRVRGRYRSKQDTESDKNLTESTTNKAIGESNNNRTARRKSYQSNKQRTNAQSNGNQSIETANKDTVSSVRHATQYTVSSRKFHASNSETESKSSTELPANHQPENHRKTYGDATTRKTPTGRRYRIRTVEANSINVNSPSAENGKKVPSSTTTTTTTTTTENSRSTLKVKKTDARDAIDEEQNYPEHFKALLKSKKATVPPSQSAASGRINSFLPKKHTASATTVRTESTSTMRPAYKHKKVDRPNLKLLFPSLQKSSTTTTDAAPNLTEIENDQTATDEIPTETITPLENHSSTTAKSRTTVQKQIGGIKFSSKIRTENDDLTSLSAFRSRSTPSVFDGFKSSTQRLPTKTDTIPANHRYSAVSSKFERLFAFILMLNAQNIDS